MTNPLLYIKAGGLSFIDFVNWIFEPYEKRTLPMPAPGTFSGHLDRCADLFQQNLDSEFVVDGRYLAAKNNDMGDMCIWQGVYAATCAFKALSAIRSGSQPSPDYRLAMTRLADLVTDDGILCRGAWPTIDLRDEGVHIDPTKTTYWVDRDLTRRGDASLDSLVGFLFGVSAYLVAVKNGAPKVSVLNLAIEDLAIRVHKDGHWLSNRDGSHTRYGDLRPGLAQGPIRNLAIATLYRLYEVSMDSGFPSRLWRDIACSYGLDFKRTETHFLWKHAWFNDNLAVLAGAAYCMVTPADEPGGSAARDGLRRLLRKTMSNGNSLLHYLCEMVGVDADLDYADMFLGEFDLSGAGKVSGEVINSQDDSIPKVTWGKKGICRYPLPAWRRPPSDFIWQRDPHTLDGGDSTHFNCLDFLVVYYLRKLSARSSW